MLRKKFPKNLTLGYININSIRNKLNGFMNYVKKSLNVIAFAETKIDDSFPSSQFYVNDMKKPLRLDVSEKSGGLLVYVDNNISSKQVFPKSMQGTKFQIIALEINLQKHKFILFVIYRPPKDDLSAFLNVLSESLDETLTKFDRFIIMGDFNANTENKSLKQFIDEYRCKSLIGSNTCFKSENGSCIDLILSNHPFSHQQNKTFETGFSDHHHLIYTMLKSKYERLPPKRIVYRDLKNFDMNQFKNEILNQCNDENELQNLNEKIEKIMDTLAPYKQKLIRGNNKPHITKALRKEIMTRLRLKNRYNKTKSEIDFENYKATKK